MVPMVGLVRVAVSEAKRNATLLRLSVITNDKAASNREKRKKVSILLLTFSVATLKHSRQLVPMAGLEPARMLLRGILSPLRLPISPHRQIKY